MSDADSEYSLTLIGLKIHRISTRWRDALPIMEGLAVTLLTTFAYPKLVLKIDEPV